MKVCFITHSPIKPPSLQLRPPFIFLIRYTHHQNSTSYPHIPTNSSPTAPHTNILQCHSPQNPFSHYFTTPFLPVLFTPYPRLRGLCMHGPTKPLQNLQLIPSISPPSHPNQSSYPFSNPYIILPYPPKPIFSYYLFHSFHH